MLMIMVFIIFFELSIGPICWLYLAEILPEKALSISVFVNWSVVAILGFFTGSLIDVLKPYGTFGIFTVCLIAGLIFAIFVMKETKGLSKTALKSLYAPKGYHGLYDQSPNSSHSLMEEEEQH